MVFTAVVGAISAYSAYKTGQNQKKQMKKQMEMQRQANLEARQRAKEAKERAQIDQNKANRKKADVSALSAKEEQAALTGPAGTMLTGNQGVDPEKLKLGGSTLLGG